MSFAQPAWFWALLLVPVLGTLYGIAEMRSRRTIAQIVAPRLRNELAAGVSYAKRRWRTILMLLGFTALVVAMARPQWGYEWQDAKFKGRDVIVAVDVSKSMLANDLSPNRLTRARLATQDLVGMLKGERLGLVAFAGSAFLQAPLTADHGAVLTAAQELDTELIPRGGTNLAEAIQTALKAFGKGEGSDRALVLFTDGEELDADGLKEAKKAKEAGVKIFTVGVGSTEGSAIPKPGRSGGTDFVRDRSNQIVKSKLDETRLREIAKETGGFYSRFEGLPTIERIVNEGIKGLKATEADSKMSRKAVDRYQWPLAAGIAFLMLASMIGDRRRRPAAPVTVSPEAKKMAGAALALVAGLFLVLGSPSARADTPEKLYADGKYKESLEAYEGLSRKSSQNKVLQAIAPQPSELDFDIGAAAYKAKDYGKAMEAFSKVLLSNNEGLREKAYYNLGNTLFQKGATKEKSEEKIAEWENALQKYDDALRLNSENPDAKHNRDVVVKLIDEEKKKQEQQKQDQQKQDQQKQDQQKQDQQKQDQQKQDQQKQDQQKQDQQKQDQQKQDQQKQDQQKQDQQKQDQQKQDQQKQDQQKQDQQKQDQQKQDQQKQDQQKQDQQKQDQQKQDQQKQDQAGQSGQDQKPGEQAKNQQGQGEPKDEKKDGKEGDQEKKQDQAGKENEQEKQKPEEQKGDTEEQKKEEESQTAKNEPKEQKEDKDGKNQEQESEETPDPKDVPREGELKAADGGEQKDGKEAAQAAQMAQVSEDDKREGDGYTKTEARRLLDSLKSEDDKINLFDKRWKEPVYKDW